MPIRQYIRPIAFWLMLLAVTVAFYQLLKPFLLTVFWALLLSIIFQNSYRRIRIRLRGRDNTAAILTTLLIVLCVVIPGFFLVLALINESLGVYQRLQSGEWNLAHLVDVIQEQMPRLEQLLRQVADSYKKLVYEYERFQEMRKKVKEEQAAEVNDERLKRRLLRDDDLDENISSEDENRFMNLDYHEDFTEEEINEYIEALKNDPRNSKVDFDNISKEDLYKFATSKSLNISADYSKYLIKLSLSSAYYDPKSRSMRENPNPEDLTGFKGDNHARLSGDTQKLNEVENFINRANVLNKDLNVRLFYNLA